MNVLGVLKFGSQQMGVTLRQWKDQVARKITTTFFEKENSLEDTESCFFDCTFADCLDRRFGLQKEDRTHAGHRTGAGHVCAASDGAIERDPDGDFGWRPGAVELEDDQREHGFN